MKKEKFYWKVVRNINGKFYSLVIHHGKYCLQYKIGKRIVSPVQGVFVFNTRQHARDFIKYDVTSTGPLKILKVKSIGIEIEDPTFYAIHMLCCNLIRRDNSRFFPKGTKCFKSIIPFEISH